MDVDLDAAKRSADRVGKVLHDVEDEYDVAVLDCAPGLSLLATNVVRAADVVLAPIVPSPLSLRTLDQVVDITRKAESAAAVVAFLSMVDRRRALHRDVVELLHGRYGDVAQAVIPNAAVVERMGQRRRPVVATTPESAPSIAYRELWEEVAQRLGIEKRPSAT
jgi:cellulose biosynthesis protein BcsQ